MLYPIVIVGIPYAKYDECLVKTAVNIHKELAGVECYVVCEEDVGMIGWVNMHNNIVSKLHFDYYCFSCADYKPRKDYLKLAIARMQLENKGLCAFNDGKWDGKIASTGVISKEYYARFGLFYPGYKNHGADDEITMFAKMHNEFCYEPLAYLEEIDGRNDRSKKKYNKDDYELLLQRTGSGFK